MQLQDLALLAAATLIALRLLALLGRYIDRRHGGEKGVDLDTLRGEVQDLRARVDDAEQLRLRVAELEERVDFAERLLARERERSGLKEGA